MDSHHITHLEIDPKVTMAALYDALAKAQGAFQPIEKNRNVSIAIKDKQTGQSRGSYSFRYADLEEILSKTRPALSANGLSLIQTINNGVMSCRLLHSGGGSIVSDVTLPTVRDMGDPKAFGAAITYLRRYLITAILGVAADDDLDESGDHDGGFGEDREPSHSGRGKPEVSPPQRRHKINRVPGADDANEEELMATAGEVAYITKKIESSGLSLGELCEREGLPGVELSSLTKAQFVALKAALV